ARRMHRSLPRNGTLVEQERDNYLAGLREAPGTKAIELRPDILIRIEGRVVVADTKWKRIETDRSGWLAPKPGDIYQMHAYASTYQCEELALIYPWTEALAGAHETTYELPAIGQLRPRISIVCVDVASQDYSLRRFGNAQTIAELFGG